MKTQKPPPGVDRVGCRPFRRLIGICPRSQGRNGPRNALRLPTLCRWPWLHRSRCWRQGPGCESKYRGSTHADRRGASPLSESLDRREEPRSKSYGTSQTDNPFTASVHRERCMPGCAGAQPVQFDDVGCQLTPPTTNIMAPMPKPTTNSSPFFIGFSTSASTRSHERGVRAAGATDSRSDPLSPTAFTPYPVDLQKS